MNHTIKIKLFLLDTVKIDSIQHRTFKRFNQGSLECFPKFIATGIKPKYEDTLEILTNEKLYSLQMDSISNEVDKIMVSFDILKAIWFIHQEQYFMGTLPIQNYLLINKQQNRVKFKPYLAVSVNQFQWSEIKKDKLTAKNGIELCFQLQKIPYKLDIWKWAIFSSTLLYKFSLDKYIDKVFTCQKIQEFVPEIPSSKNSYLGSEELIKMMEKCLKVNPKDRPQIHHIVDVYRKIIANQSLQIDSKILKSSNQLSNSEEKAIQAEPQLQLTQNIILTQKLKKKIISFFNRSDKKSPTAYKPLYRATKFKFSPRLFYEQCSQCSNLLFVIDSEETGIICCYIEPAITRCEDGLTGAFISDQTEKSFIYSEKNQGYYKLMNKDKAFRSMPGFGPIIGDGDIILGSSKQNNWCYFPISYNGGSKRLTTKQQFVVRNYDVYRVIF